MSDFKKILIVGPAGCGKTTLSNHLSKITGYKVIHLDHEYWLPNWQKPEEESFRNKVYDFVKEDSWIIEGNFFKTFDIRCEKAELIIYLKPRRMKCIFGILHRVFTRRKKMLKRADLPDGCIEKLDFSLLKWSFNYNKLYAPIIENIISKYPHLTVKVFKTRRSAHKFIETL